MTPAAAPMSGQALLEEALAALDTPLAEAMLPAVERALRLAPNDFRLWHVHGLIHRQYDRRELALPSLDRAAALAPNVPLIAHARARTLFEAGLDSVDAYGRALELAPGDPAVMAGMTSALFAIGAGDAAMAGLEQILGRSPLWIQGHKLLSDLRWMSGERAGFDRSFDAALKVHPQHFGLRREQILVLIHAAQWDRVLEVIAAGRVAMGDQPLFVANEAVCCSELGDIARADALFAECAGIVDGPLQLRIVRHLLRSGRAEQALPIIDRWLADPAEAKNYYPYASAAWRLTGDPRWQWLEGDERFVGVYDIADRLPPLDALAATLRTLHKARGQPLEQSVRGGTQTDGDLFSHIDPQIVALREAVRETIAHHVAQLPAADPGHPLLGPPRSPIRFAGSWSVRLQEGGRHSNHVHPMGWISSALYIVLPPDLGQDQAGWLTIGEPQAELGLGLAPLRLIEPKPGRLVLFPSTMWHGTKPFQSGERLTVAFDVAVPS